MDQIVNLNVGGRLFSTLKSTLLSAGDDTMLARLLRTDVGVLKDAQGAIFVDRNPDVFALVLDVLRDQKASPTIVKGSSVSWKRLEEELRYFCISGLDDEVSDSALRQLFRNGSVGLAQMWVDNYKDFYNLILTTVVSDIKIKASKAQVRPAQSWFLDENLCREAPLKLMVDSYQRSGLLIPWSDLLGTMSRYCSGAPSNKGLFVVVFFYLRLRLNF
jgi:hypothetical protein